MKKLLLLLLLAPVLATAQVCCPQPPDGEDCYPEAPALLPGSSQIETVSFTGPADMMVGQTHVTQYFVFYHPQVAGFTYEVQYTDDLLSGQWKAYARWEASRDAIVTTYVPIYPCVPHRFLRVCATPPPVLSNTITQANHKAKN